MYSSHAMQQEQSSSDGEGSAATAPHRIRTAVLRQHSGHSRAMSAATIGQPRRQTLGYSTRSIVKRIASRSRTLLVRGGHMLSETRRICPCHVGGSPLGGSPLEYLLIKMIRCNYLSSQDNYPYLSSSIACKVTASASAKYATRSRPIFVFRRNWP